MAHGLICLGAQGGEIKREDTGVRDIIRSQMREREDHQIVLTHGDLHAINVLARPGVGVVAIIDWELAGFYPEYLEMVRPYRPFD